MGKYVSEVIGDNYKNWKMNQIILMEAPTGSGKTTFILENLVEYAALNGRRILYLVNRTILKKQLEEKINTEIKVRLKRRNDKEFNKNLSQVIEIKMYQTIENECRSNPEELEDEYSEYHYIVADECHYFLMDSTFNTYTQLSYDWVMKKRERAVVIFISATIERIKKFMREENGVTFKENYNEQGELPDRRGMNVQFQMGDMKVCGGNTSVIQPYHIDGDYSYIKLNVLENNNDIIKTIQYKKGKWLVFVDSIKKGETITKSLKEVGIEAVFIDSILKENDYSIRKTIKEISKMEYFSEQVLIATAVMDNGISITDMRVRNLIIMSDTREEFIQMLGRKRRLNDRDILDIYILLRDESEFKKRLAHVKKCLRFIMEHESEEFFVSLDDIMESENLYSCAQNVCYVWQGILKLNNFSFEQYRYLMEHYSKIIKRFENEGMYAFVKEQMEWIGKGEDEINEIAQSQKERLLKWICDSMEKYIDVNMDKEVNITFRDSIRDHLRDLLEIKMEETENNEAIERIKKNIDELRKSGRSKNNSPGNNRTLAPDKFNDIMDILELKYKMEKSNEIKDIAEGGDTYCRIIKCNN